jgi:hypothetical protein
MMTRLVTASQMLPATSGSASTSRKTLITILDFHVPEKPFLDYVREPLYPRAYSSPRTLDNSAKVMHEKLQPKTFSVVMKQFDLILRIFEHRPDPSSAGAQNSLGFSGKNKTSQDDAPFVQRTNTNWLRATEPLETYGERCAALG